MLVSDALTTKARQRLSWPSVSSASSQSYSNGILEKRLRTYQAFGSATVSGNGRRLLRLCPEEAVADSPYSSNDYEDHEGYGEQWL